MRMNAAVREVDRGMSRLMADLQQVKAGIGIKVGVLDDGKGAETRDGGLTNAELAALHEFGSLDGKIPERSFIRSTFDRWKGSYTAMYERALKSWIEGRGALDPLLNAIGAKMASDIKQAVTGGAPIPPPNAPSVLARKQRLGEGLVRTLVDTGRMVASVTWAVVRGGA